MTDYNWEEIEKIVDQALLLPREEQLAFIEQQCRGKQGMKGEVTLLLESIYDSEGWLENPDDYHHEFYNDISQDIKLLSSEQSLVGMEVGSYIIREQLGEGGMGSVYLAERAGASFNHKVAIKIIRQRQATDSNIQRFKQEQRILAGLNHPGIARFFDAGITESGFPYIIMEYIEGVDLINHCKSHQCTVEERIALFKEALEAVRHAHQNLVIHRDLKPGNILVDNNGSVKIIDFGISKLIEDEESADLTQTGARMLTPLYAAPEQIRQENITTATDLYALGVIFYQLFAGKNPFKDYADSTYATEQAILHAEPPKPSSVNGTIIPQKTIRGDLDAIALKAIRKEAEERYRVANEFLEDLIRYEDGKPVSACRDSLQYRTKKFLRRHKKAVATAAGVAILIIALTSIYTWNIAAERHRAQTEAEKAEEVTQFLIDLFNSNTPEYSKGDTITARQLLHTGEQKINALNDQPAVKARMLGVLGEIQALLSNFQKADSLQRASLSINKSLYENPSPELAASYFSLAASEQNLGHFNRSLKLIDTALTYQKNLFGAQSAEVAKSLRLQAESLRKGGAIDSAAYTIRKAQTIFRTLGDTTGEQYLRTLMQLSAVSVAAGRFKEAEAVSRHSLQLSKQLFNPPHPTILMNMDNLALALKEQNEYTEAESLYVDELRMSRQIYGNNHVNTATTLNNLAGLYYYTKNYAKADSLYTQSYAILKDLFGEDNPRVVSVLYNRANLKLGIKDYKNAEMLFKKVLKSDRISLGEKHPNVATDYVSLATLYKKQKKYDQALSYYHKSLKLRRQIYSNPNHPYIAYNERGIADILAQTGHIEKADSLYKKALTSLAAEFGKNHGVVKNIANVYSHFLSEKRDVHISADSLISTLSTNH